MKAEKLFIVYKPTKDSEKEDVFNGEPTTIQNLYNQFRGGLNPEMIHGIFTDRQEAQDEAELLEVFRVSMQSEFDPFCLPKKDRFIKFINALEELSTKYGVAIKSTGGVYIFDEKRAVQYSDDPTNGNLNPVFPIKV